MLHPLVARTVGIGGEAGNWTKARRWLASSLLTAVVSEGASSCSHTGAAER